MNKSNSQGEDPLRLSLPKHIGIIYSDVKREYFPSEEAYISEKDAESNAKVIAKHIEVKGIRITLYPGDKELPIALLRDKPEMVINLVDTVRGNECLFASIAGTLELLDIPYTGVGIMGSALNTNKYLTKKILREAGVPVPNFQLFHEPNEQLEIDMRYPLFVKLNEMHSSVGISEKSIVRNDEELEAQIKYLFNIYDQDVLVEEYIEGREIYAVQIEGGNRKVYLAERNFPEDIVKNKIVTFDAKWIDYLKYDKFKKYEDDYLKELVKNAFDACRLDDYARFEIRMDNSNRYYFIDVNANPFFGPIELMGAMALVLKCHDIEFDDLLDRLIFNTLRDSRKNIEKGQI